MIAMKKEIAWEMLSYPEEDSLAGKLHMHSCKLLEKYGVELEKWSKHPEGAKPPSTESFIPLSMFVHIETEEGPDNNEIDSNEWSRTRIDRYFWKDIPQSTLDHPSYGSTVKWLAEQGVEIGK